jgi:hypothetical protein
MSNPSARVLLEGFEQRAMKGNFHFDHYWSHEQSNDDRKEPLGEFESWISHFYRSCVIHVSLLGKPKPRNRKALLK